MSMKDNKPFDMDQNEVRINENMVLNRETLVKAYKIRNVLNDFAKKNDMGKRYSLDEVIDKALDNYASYKLIDLEDSEENFKHPLMNNSNLEDRNTMMMALESWKDMNEINWEGE